MDRRTFIAITGGALLGLSPNLRAQGQVTTRRIGVLSAFARADNLVINLKAAKALGLTIPQSLLLRADEVIQ